MGNRLTGMSRDATSPEHDDGPEAGREPVIGSFELTINAELIRTDPPGLTPEALQAAEPMRAFAWRRDQLHYPGWYYSATDGALVSYESRLELTRLRIADYDREVRGIRAQPFRMIFIDRQGKLRRHVPDFALLRTDGSVLVVNVKAEQILTVSKKRQVLEDAHHALQRLGIRSEVWTQPDPTLAINLRFIGPCRNRALFTDAERAAALKTVRGPSTISAAEERLADVGINDPRCLIFHMIWHHEFVVDLQAAPLEGSTVLNAAQTR